VTDDPATPTQPCAATHEDLAVFAHELRGALTVIAGYVEMLRDPSRDIDRPAALDGIRRAVSRADTLCSEMLSGPAPDHPVVTGSKPVSLSALAEHVAAEQRAATGHAILVETHGEVVVTGDEPSLSRMLTNVVANASKFSPAQKPVLIEVTCATSPQLGEIAVIDVSDRGPGIPADRREALFEPFERLDRDAHVPGTGLGLAIVKGVAVSHGGRVEIRDRTGGGTTVRIEIPLSH
jgi:signal transduction histidine kinase